MENTLLCVIEGDQGTPVRMWSLIKTGEKKRQKVKDFVDEWANIFCPPNEFHKEISESEKQEIVENVMKMGSYWYDETWCFQLHNTEKRL